MTAAGDRRSFWSVGPVAAILLVATLAACSYPQRNHEAANLNPRSGYRWTALEKNELSDTLFIVTASGGGTRAAALALSTLRGLDQARLASGRSLAKEIDVISSVSGGSVTAAYFALEGVEGFATLEQDFIRQDGISTMLWRGLNPVGLAELATPSKERIDLLIDYLDDTLFQDATFQALEERGKRPYLILNAGDMVAGTTFPFTKAYLELLCSNLRDIKLSVAVAASAAFPVALSPVTLKNYSPCAAQKVGVWPPIWIKNAVETDWYINPSRVRRGRVARSYANGTKVPPPDGKVYVHLLDGGIADNIGVSEPFRLLTTAGVSPQFLIDIGRGRIKRVVFVLVNVRSDPPSALNDQVATPGEIDMLLGTISAAMDNATFATIERLRILLKERFKAAAEEMPPALAGNFKEFKAFFVPVDFGAIPDDDCRRMFESIATSWTLPRGEIDALFVAGGALLYAAPEFRDVLDIVGAEIERPLPTIEQACAVLEQARQAEQD
jgi:predicted acylesterase/phospholipase RssA